MPDMPATDAAVEYARSRPDLSFGVHLTFVTDGLDQPARRPGRARPPARAGRPLPPDGRGAAPRAPAADPRRADRARGRGAADVPARPRRARLARRLAPARAQVRPLPRGARRRPAPLRRAPRPQRPGRLAAASAEEPDVLARRRLAATADAPLRDDRSLLHADERPRHWLGRARCSPSRAPVRRLARARRAPRLRGGLAARRARDGSALRPRALAEGHRLVPWTAVG